MKLNVVSIERELVRVQAEGEISAHDFTADGKNPFEVMLGARWASHQVVVDLRAVPFLDSSAIGWFMCSRREFERGGGMVVLHSIQPRVRQVLDLLRVGKALPLADNEAAALRVVTAAKVGSRADPVVAPVVAPVAAAATPVRLKRAPARKKDAKRASGKARRGAKAA